ncbi:PPOX class F420-dependent oxidoreductase [Dactylosporangium sp. CA-233914]|uniref:PPOX class F420-dependent oxidoreductase n=1 Tax=Dactylosporangium sp. CA-233914 TaxID=3239934 RepID=UPI003D94CF17
MSVFSDAELAYLREDRRRLGRLATVGPDGMPHVAPLGFSLGPGGAYIDMSGRNFERSKKFRDVAASRRAALVIDDVLPPWQPRGIEVRGRAEAIPGPPALIRLIPERVISWGLHAGRSIEDTYRARDVRGAADA